MTTEPGSGIGNGSLKWTLSMKKSHVIPLEVLCPVVAATVTTVPAAANPISAWPLLRFAQA